MTVYATGTTGTIGRHLPGNVEEFKVDLLDPNLVLPVNIFTSQDSLIHLAGVVGPGLVNQDLETSYQINVQATLNMAKEFLSQGGGRFVYVSTSHIYEKSQEILKENSPVNPISNYAKQKYEAESKLSELFKSQTEKLCITRVFSVLDWDVAPFTLGGAIAKLLDPTSDFILQNATDIRDFLTPKKIAEVLYDISMESSLFGKVNLCTGVGTTVLQAAETMLKKMGHEIPSGRVELGNSGNPCIVGDNSKLLRHLPNLDLAWTPSTRA